MAIKFFCLSLLLSLFCSVSLAQGPDAKGLAPIQALTVFDATGKRVGTLETNGFASVAVVSFRVNRFPFALVVYRDQMVGNAGVDVFFEAANCTGTPFLPVLSTLTVLPLTTVARPGSTVYLADPDASPQAMNAISRLPRATATSPGGPCVAIAPSTYNAVRAIPLTDLEMHFTAPFRVR